jgi:hypothetical protein
VIDVLNGFVNTVFDLWLSLFQSLSVTWQIIITAIPVTVFALLVFRFASNQAGIHSAKNKIKAYLLELWLFKDDLGVSFRAQGRVLAYSLIYLRHALLPLLIMIVPIGLVIVQIESLFAFRALQPGESAILTVTAGDSLDVSEIDAQLHLPDGLLQETPPLRIDDTRQIMWRIRGNASGEHEAVIGLGDNEITKRIVVGDTFGRLAPVVYASGDWRMLGYPAEPAIDSATGIIAVEMPYERDRAEFAGLSSASWLLFLATLVLGFAMRGFFGVTF